MSANFGLANAEMEKQLAGRFVNELINSFSYSAINQCHLHLQQALLCDGDIDVGDCVVSEVRQSLRLRRWAGKQ